MKLLNKYFKYKEAGSSLKTEIIAGVTTFLTMAYIIILNPLILEATGMDKGSIFIATILISAISSIFMGLYAKLPIALAPGMGLNAFFTYVIVISFGLSWQLALFAVFCSGILFLLISVSSLRKKIIDGIPNSLKIGIGTGVGLFLLFIGLQNAGIIVKNDATITGIGDLKSITVILSCIGFLFILILETRKIKGSLIISILLITLCSFFFTDNTYQGIVSALPEYKSFLKLDFDISALLTAPFLIVVFSLLFVDFFDSTGTIIAIHQSLKNDSPSSETSGTGTSGTKTSGAEISGTEISNKPLIVDSLATILGSLLGTSTATVYIESATGVKQGGRTGLTAIVTGILFLLCLFFFPLVNSIPAYATAPALIYVGFLFLQNLKNLDLNNLFELIPAAVAALIMPFTFSISYGIIFGFLTYLVINIGEGKIKQISPVVWIISAISIAYLVFA